MANTERRAAERRRAWGRGPMILRFEPLEGRQLLATFATTGTSSGASSAATSTAGTTSATTGDGSAPDLVVADFNAPASLAWGGTFHAVGDVSNQGGSTTTAGYTVQVYASTTSTINASAVLVGTINMPAGLAPSSMAHFDQVLTAPAAAPTDLGGGSTYYLSLRVNAGQTVAESRYDNNEAPGGYQGYAPVTVAPSQNPSLSTTALSATPTTTGWGGSLSVGATVANNGLGAAPATRARVVLTPTGATPGGAADTTIGSIDVPALGAGQSSVLSQAVTLPSTIPANLVGSTQVILSLILDADHAVTTAGVSASQGYGIDGVLLTPAAGTGTTADASKLPALSVQTVQVPSKALSYGQPFQVSAVVQNPGKADAGPFKVRFALVDDSDTTQPPLTVVDASLPSLQAGYAQDVVQTIPFPSTLAAGLQAGATVNAHVVVTVDPDHALTEATRVNESLNGQATSIALAPPPAGVGAPLPADGTITTAAAVAATTTATTAAATTGTPAATTVGTSTSVTGAATPTLSPAQKRAAALANAKARREVLKADAAIARAKVRAKALANAQALAAHHHRVK